MANSTADGGPGMAGLVVIFHSLDTGTCAISVVASHFRSDFGGAYGVTYTDGPIRGLLARAVVVIDGEGTVIYTEQVSETSHERDYDAALAALN